MAAAVQHTPAKPAGTVLSLPNAPKALSHLQWRAVRLLAAGKTKSEVLDELHIQDQTFRRWRTWPYFNAEVTRARNAFLNECVEQAKQDFSSLGPLAVQCLRAAMLAGGGPGVKAALAVSQSTGVMAPQEDNQSAVIKVQFGRIEEDAGNDPANPSPN